MKKAIFLFLFSAAGMTMFSGCTKKSTSGNDAAKFVGTWTGSSSCSGTMSFTWTAGSDGTKAVSSGSAGANTCAKAISLVGTASGNTIVFGPTTVTDNCGNSYTITETGTLSGSTLTMVETVSGAITATCSFTGTK